jgi:hypothetical protein
MSSSRVVLVVEGRIARSGELREVTFHVVVIVIARHSRPKDSVASLAYARAIQ